MITRLHILNPRYGRGLICRDISIDVSAVSANHCTSPMLPNWVSSTRITLRSSLVSSIHQKSSYHERVLDHFHNPRNIGTLNRDDSRVGTGLVGAPACGDVMRLQLKFSPQGVIEDAKFKTFGCGSAIASSSLITEWVKGKSIGQCLEIKNNDIAKHLSLPPVKLHCSMLAEDAMKSAIANYQQKQFDLKNRANDVEMSATAVGSESS